MVAMVVMVVMVFTVVIVAMMVTVVTVTVVVGSHLGLICALYLRSCDLAVPGSPTSSRCGSPLTLTRVRCRFARFTRCTGCT